jgi:UDP-glucose 4-epimerase
VEEGMTDYGKALVTGGAGFIASHVVDLLIDSGLQVSVVDNLSSGKRKNLNPEATFYECDIRDGGVINIIKEINPDVIIHHAAQISVRESVNDPANDASINILGSLNLLEASVKSDVKKFIFASTGGAIYGEQDYFPADEAHPVRPISPYGIAKLSVEKYLFYYKEVHGLDYVSLRYSNVYGPRQDPHGEAGVVAIFSQKMLANEEPVINGDGRQTRDFVYVKDVAEANLNALEGDVSGEINIATGQETTVNELFRITNNIVGGEIEEVHGPSMKGEQLRSVLNWSLAKKTLNWEPRINLEDGLRETVDYFRGNQ